LLISHISVIKIYNKLSVACGLHHFWGSTYLGVNITVLPPLLLTGIRFGGGQLGFVAYHYASKRELP
jgi:hypothetical protein